jgi:A/G-specific adenine glycosylase
MRHPDTFSRHLLQWYDHHRADLPWRETPPNPYHVWLSEIMLQQTQIETVKGYYNAFLEAYPTITDLAAASLDDVLKLWEGLGYYSRARNLYKAAQVVAGEYGGVFPTTAKALRKLPGVGPYTAGAVASIAFDEPAPVLDGNVIRVFSRLDDLSDDVTQTATKNHLWELTAERVPMERPGDYNQALMELGQVVCRPKTPNCPACPVRQHCDAYAAGTQAERPVKKKRRPIPHYHVAAGVVWNGAGQVLIAQRPLDGLLGGLWEFPGGKQESGETLPACLMRELREEVGIEVEVGELFCVVKHAFTHFKITLHAFTCQLAPGSPAPHPIEARAVKWATLDDLTGYSFGKADRQVIDELHRRQQMLF